MIILKNAFPDEWKQIIEQQFWGYSGIAGSNYEPILRVLSSYDDTDIEKAIEQLKNPENIRFEFMILLSEKVGIDISTDDISFGEEYLWYIEEAKYEVLRNAKYLIKKGISEYMVEKIICNAPYLMMLSELEVEARLKEGFGEDYITSMEEIDSESFYEKLEEIAW